LKTVRECFYAHQGRLIDKWDGYLDVYQKHFAKYVGTKVRILEIGVSHGGSLQLWKEYFGENARITGIDIDNRCADYAEQAIDVVIADQSDEAQMEEVAQQFGPFDIVIDDGSHVKEHQIASFNAIWPRTKGPYLIEDCHTGYPDIQQTGGFVSKYPWMMVIERPKRIIRGNPSREMRQDEVDAFNLYSDPPSAPNA
jgi:cephalosporin hydroxylase